jgi:hypothetical protein
MGEKSEGATTGDTVKKYQLNFMLSVIRGIKPSDQVEAMIGAQMAVVHSAFDLRAPARESKLSHRIRGYGARLG